MTPLARVSGHRSMVSAPTRGGVALSATDYTPPIIRLRDSLPRLPTKPLSPEAAFDGSTYVPALDYRRLTGSQAKVHALLQDGEHHTDVEISGVAGCKQTAAGARARDLRKKKYGNFNVQCTPFGQGLWKYRLEMGTWHPRFCRCKGQCE